MYINLETQIIFSKYYRAIKVLKELFYIQTKCHFEKSSDFEILTVTKKHIPTSMLTSEKFKILN